MISQPTLREFIIKTFIRGRWYFYFGRAAGHAHFIFITKDQQLATTYFPERQTLEVNYESDFIETLYDEYLLRSSNGISDINIIKEVLNETFGLNIKMIYTINWTLSGSEYEKLLNE